jgi:quinone-modifying oxidoreductase, subunit QmoC
MHLSKTFWDNATKYGRVNEVKLTQSLYFKDGFVRGQEGHGNAVGRTGLVKAGRLNPLEALGMGHKCKDLKGIQKCWPRPRA